MKPFAIRGFNPCESLLRHTPEQLRTFLRRMKTLHMNTIIIHYDYGWSRYRDLIMEECGKAGIEIILMTFGPRTFLSYSDWKPEWFAKKADGKPFTVRLECETYPCRFEPEALEAFEYGAVQWLKNLPPQIRHVHMRAADGILFCECEKCRKLPAHERWQPFVEIFTKAVLEHRPDLRFETDVYTKRYNIPSNRAPFHAMTDIMYDTFYRTQQFPLNSGKDLSTRESVLEAATEAVPDAPTAGLYHVNRLKEWTSAFPGKIYIHENAMAQSFCGTFQFGTGSFLKDMEFYRKLGIQGICYEAYEPGYSNFSEMFEILARAMNGEEVDYTPSPVETAPRNPGGRFCIDPDFPLEKYFRDPFRLKQNQLYRRFWLDYSLDLYREYIQFAFENEDRMDPLFTGSFLSLYGIYLNKIRFRDLTEQKRDFLSRRKLWDFMEDIPSDQDPRKVCRSILESLVSKAEAV